MNSVFILAQSDGSTQNAAAGAAAGAAIIGFILFMLAIVAVVYVVMAISTSKILQKAGQPGWPGWVPIYNLWRLFEISGKPGALSLIILASPIPIVGSLAGLAVSILLGLAVGKAFNKSTGFQVGLILLGIVFYPILAFGDSTYQPQSEQGFPVGPAK